jgi:superfamily II DNA or RNA helicase
MARLGDRAVKSQLIDVHGGCSMAFSIFPEVLDKFSDSDIIRGADYHGRGRISKFVMSDSTVSAKMNAQDGGYRVGLSSDGSTTHCTCSQFANRGACGHVWAVILEFMQRDSAQLFAPLPAPAALPAPVAQLDKWITAIKRPTTSVSLTESPQLRQAGHRYEFVIDLSLLDANCPFHFYLFSRKRRKDGQMGRPKSVSIEGRSRYYYGPPNRQNHEPRLVEALDRCVGYPYSDVASHSTWTIPGDRRDSICSTFDEIGQWYWVLSEDEMDGIESDKSGNSNRIRWDGLPFEPLIQLVPTENETGRQCEVQFLLVRDSETVNVAESIWAFSDGVILLKDRLIQVSPLHGPWAQLGRKATGNGPFLVPEENIVELLERLARLPNPPAIQGADQFGQEPQPGVPEGHLLVSWLTPNTISAQVEIAYGELRCDPNQGSRYVWDNSRRVLVSRNHEAERQILDQLLELPFQTEPNRKPNDAGVTLASKDLLSVVETLMHAGWEVRADGKPLRKGGGVPSVSVVSNQDWFDVHVAFDFSGSQVGLPALLKAAQRNQTTVILDDGSVGILPDKWLEQNAGLLSMADNVEDGLRFQRSQAFLLDSLLSDHEVKHKDKDFTQLVRKLKKFDGVRPAKKPRSFHGTLRSYQEQGLGWFRFLQDFNFGGCLADDMGLGKTIQVLALLEKQRAKRIRSGELGRPSLVVVPKSLVFNWIDEAKQFTPLLRVMDYTGLTRIEKRKEWDEYDVIVTTYGTLRRDVTHLKDREFDYVVLDEAQAIKNPNSLAAKASRLMSGHHRLAMTGTPIENHLGDLWSIMEFLNPGMLGRLSAFQKMTGSSKPDPENLQHLQSALAPFILRRTKEEVLTDLPEKTEQTIMVDLPPRQRKQYNELRDYYRSHLTGKVNELGMGKAKIHVLEALLRTRQVACDPRLLDPKSKVVGAKIECLLEQLETVVKEGSKALVFSQFTTLLNLVKPELEKRSLTYEYLDGKTQRRAACVKRFQNNPDLSVFLISLKAGGHGLNLTAADYVFILDPWWNPATEAQAIDRAHRIGQTKPVMAYRLIARDTIEEKIMALQQEKRELADSIIRGNGSLMQNLTADDLATLFS